MERMNLSEAEVGRAMNPPNDIGNSEMSDMEESKEESSMMSNSQRRYAKRNCRKNQENWSVQSVSLHPRVWRLRTAAISRLACFPAFAAPPSWLFLCLLIKSAIISSLRI